MGLEKGVDQGFLGVCLGPRLRAGEAQEEDQDWLLESGGGLLRERERCHEKGNLSEVRPHPPTIQGN